MVLLVFWWRPPLLLHFVILGWSEYNYSKTLYLHDRTPGRTPQYCRVSIAVRLQDKERHIQDNVDQAVTHLQGFALVLTMHQISYFRPVGRYHSPAKAARPKPIQRLS